MGVKVLDEAIALHNVAFYRNTEKPARDKIFNWLVDLYTKKGKKWEKSDEVIFGGFIYVIADYFGYILLFGALWWFVTVMVRTKGEWHALFFLLIFLVVRVGMLLSAVRHSNRLHQK